MSWVQKKILKTSKMEKLTTYKLFKDRENAIIPDPNTEVRSGVWHRLKLRCPSSRGDGSPDVDVFGATHRPQGRKHSIHTTGRTDSLPGCYTYEPWNIKFREEPSDQKPLPPDAITRQILLEPNSLARTGVSHAHSTMRYLGYASGAIGKAGDFEVFDSPRAGGKYWISGTAAAKLISFNDNAKRLLTTWLCEQRRAGVEVPKIQVNVLDLVKSRKPLQVMARVNAGTSNIWRSYYTAW